MNVKLKSILLTLFTAFFVVNFIMAQDDNKTNEPAEKSAFAKGLDQMKLQKGKRLFQEYNYRGAHAIYEELYASDKNNPLINYRLGQCYFMLKDYTSAVKMFEQSVEKTDDLDDEAPFYYGRALHRVGELDKAQTQVEKYRMKLLSEKKYQDHANDTAYNREYANSIYKKNTENNEAEEVKMSEKLEATLSDIKNNKYSDGTYNYDALEEANMELADIKYAKQQIQQPVDVKITNMGIDINSSFDDYGPSISSDGKTLYFTSRRPDTRGGGTDDNNDGKYFEDIYTSTWDDVEQKWSKSEGIEGRLNSEYHDACLGISPDGQYFYIYKNFGVNGSGQIFESKMGSSGKWGSPKMLDENINTSYWESSASLTADGQKMYFVSERKGGFGMGDIWVSERVSKNEWGVPVNIGATINTPEDEKMVVIHPEGNILFFASEGHKGLGGYDIYMSEFKKGKWQTPINLGYPINTVDDDVNFTLSKDLKTAYYSGFKKESFGERDIYQIDVTNLALIKRVREMYVTLTGSITDAVSGEEMKGSSKMTITDEDGNIIKEMKVDTGTSYETKIERGKKITITVKASGYKENTQTIFIEDKNKTSETLDFKMGR